MVNLGSSLRIFPWSSTGGLISYTARRQDAIEYNELSLKCLPGQILGKKFLMSAYGEYVVFTDRRPNPNAAQSGSLISGLSFPSFRYRSGWNSRGLSKTLGSFNIDLNEKFSTEIGLADHTNHALPIMIVPFGIKKPLYSSSIVDMWGTPSELVRIVMMMMIQRAYQEVILDSNVTIPLQQHWYMAEKYDRENLGVDLGQRQRQFLLEPSSALQDRVPSPGIVIARLIQSNDSVSDITLVLPSLLLTVSAPAETDPQGR